MAKTKKEEDNFKRKIIKEQAGYIQINLVCNSAKEFVDKVSEKINSRIEQIRKQYKLDDNAKIETQFSNIYGSIVVTREESDKEYNARISVYEKRQATARKRKETKIKKDFEKLEELKKQYGGYSSAEEYFRATEKERIDKLLNLPA